MEFFGPNFFSQIWFFKTYLCAKNQASTLKTQFFIDFCRKLPILAGPPYFGAPDLAPLWAGPVSKKFQRVRKLVIGVYRKFQVDTGNDKKVIPEKV